MNTTDTFEIGDMVAANGVEGSIAGIFPPEGEVEVMVWVAEAYECLDGSHVAGCSGTVRHEHAGFYDRQSFPASEVRHIAVPVA